MKTKYTFLLIGAFFAFIGQISAQQLNQSPMPLTADMEPSATVPGGIITFSGTAAPFNRNRQVKLNITTADGRRIELSTQVNSANNYKIQFKQTEKTGTYRVTVKGPHNQGSQNLTFKVVPFSSQSRNIISRMKDNARAVKNSVRKITSNVKNAPESPARTELQEKLENLSEPLENANDKIQSLENSLEQLADIGEKFPSLSSKIAPVFDTIDAGLRNSESISRELAASARQADRHRSMCDGLYYSAQALKTAGLLLNLPGGAMKTAESIILGLTSDNLAGLLPAQDRTATNKQFISQGLNRSLELIKEPVIALDNAVGAINDIIPFAVDEVFERYCEKFTGPVSASIDVTVKEKGRPWWKYTVQVNAVMNIRYEKSNGSATIPVTGEIEGVGSKFTVWEDLPVLEPRVRKDVLVKFAYPPLPGNLSAVSAAGLGGAATPKYFRIPLKGEISGSLIKLQLQSATVDFDKSKALIAYVLLNPVMPVVPHVMTTKLPYKGAHFIITRSLGSSPQLTIKVDRAGRISTVTERKTRNAEMQGGNINIKLKTNLKACNPDCP